MAAGAESVLDLGCGTGALLERLLLEPSLRRVVGVDRSLRALNTARSRLAFPDGTLDARLSLRQASVTDLDADLAGFDAAVLIETLEHLPPAHLSLLERSLFVRLRPGRILVTTPNREYNVMYGLAPSEYRHPGHEFEWTRAKFERWASGVAGRNGYEVSFDGFGPSHDWLGNPTQLATFVRGRL